MKNTRTAVTLLIMIAALAVLFAFLAGPVFDIDLRITKSTVTAGSTATLARVRDILALNTVEVVYKVVFPFDYVPPEMQWDLFLKQYREGRRLTPLEESYLEVYRLCEEIGLELKKGSSEFVVLTTILKGGFDLTNPVFASPELAGELASEYVTVDDSNGIYIRLPEAVITDVIIEDSDTTTYVYPDIHLAPENWKTLTSYVERRVTEKAVEHGALKIAEENGKKFLSRLLLDAGYSSVSFLE